MCRVAFDTEVSGGDDVDSGKDVTTGDASKVQRATGSAVQPSLSLGTCGLKVTHAIGVCQFVYARYVHEAIRVVVTSGGCYPGVCLASGVEPFTWFEKDYSSYCLGRWNSRFMGMFWDEHVHLKELFSRLPPCPRLVTNARLVVAVTAVPAGTNRWLACVLIGLLRVLRFVTAVLSALFGVGDLSDRLPPALRNFTSDHSTNVSLIDRFDSMRDMLDYCMCSMHIPVLFRDPTPTMCRHLDGGFGGGDGAPTLDEFTVTVQPDRSADIPSDAGPPSWYDTLTLQNLRPQATIHVARRECAQGFESARRREALFLSRGFRVRDGAPPGPEGMVNPWGSYL